MLKYLKADNYKALVNFKIEFSPLNVLIGKNGSGKTTLFELVDILKSFILSGKRIENCFPLSTLTRWQNVNIQTVEVGIDFNQHEYVYRLEIEHNHGIGKLRVKQESVTCDAHTIFEAQDGKAYLYNDSFEQRVEILTDWSLSGVGLIQERSDNKLLCEFKRAVKSVIFCSPVPHFMKDRTDTESSDLSVACDNIAAVYRFASQQNPDKLVELWRNLKDIRPEFLRTYLDGGENEKTLKFEYAAKGGESKSAYLLSELSQGEKMLFVLYFLIICYGSSGYTLLIDEPDNFLELAEIQQWLKLVEDVTAENGAQCILISHHPEIIDYLASSHGLWVKRTGYGAIQLADAPKIPDGFTTAPTYSELIKHGAF